MAEIHVCVPKANHDNDVKPKKHVTMFLKPDIPKITEQSTVPYPITCCTAAKSKSFLMT